MAEIATTASYDLNLIASLTADEEGSGIEGTHDPEPTTAPIAVKLRSNGVSALDECVDNKEESPVLRDFRGRARQDSNLRPPDS